jgi:hypothetical protein
VGARLVGIRKVYAGHVPAAFSRSDPELLKQLKSLLLPVSSPAGRIRVVRTRITWAAAVLQFLQTRHIAHNEGILARRVFRESVK